jgi:cell division cycle protein 20 (cofactor of APC complex)
LNKIIDIPAHDQRILHSSLSPDGQTLATAAADECLKFWKIFDNKGKQVLNPIGTVKAQGVLKRSNSLR